MSTKYEGCETKIVASRTKTGPKNCPILTKIGIHVDQTFDYYHAKFHQNRTTLSDKKVALKLSDFNEILRGNSHKFGLFV